MTEHRAAARERSVLSGFDPTPGAIEFVQTVDFNVAEDSRCPACHVTPGNRCINLRTGDVIMSRHGERTGAELTATQKALDQAVGLLRLLTEGDE